MAMSGVAVASGDVYDFLPAVTSGVDGPLFEFLLRVGVILEDMEGDDRRAAMLVTSTFAPITVTFGIPKIA